jgi:PPOX class probable F420-dependent enzyme
MDRSRRFVLAVTLLAGLLTTAAGVAALLTPSWFADAAGFPRHTHFVHDAGAFQLGIGVTLLLALACRDGVVLVLAGFLVAQHHPCRQPRCRPGPGRPQRRSPLRSFDKAGKTRRIRSNPRVEVAPSTVQGRSTGPGMQATARRLEGAEARRAARLLARKHPLLHGLLVPLTHRLGRAKTGKTVHFQLTPLDHGPAR